MTKKMTYVDAVNRVLEGGEITPEVIEKLEALKNSLAKKTGANRKPTKTQIENEGIKKTILNGMVVGDKYTITDLIKTIPEIANLTNQKVSSLVTQLVRVGKIKREEDGRKTYFSLV